MISSNSILSTSEQGRYVSHNEVFSGLILVVDDEKNVLKTCVKMAEVFGFTVITAADGQDGVAVFQEHKDTIKLVILDLTMPKMDGIAAMTEMYRIRPEIKVILSSGYNNEDLAGKITGPPPAGYLRKPYGLNEMETEIRRVLCSCNE